MNSLCDATKKKTRWFSLQNIFAINFGLITQISNNVSNNVLLEHNNYLPQKVGVSVELGELLLVLICIRCEKKLYISIKLVTYQMTWN